MIKKVGFTLVRRTVNGGYVKGDPTELRFSDDLLKGGVLMGWDNVDVESFISEAANPATPTLGGCG